LSLLSLQNITLSFGGPPIFNGINLQLEEGDRLCLMGRNGAGKSTLLRLMAGEFPPESGVLQRQQGIRLASVWQDIPEDISGTVFDIVAAGMGETARLLSDYHHLAHRMAVDSSAKLLEELEDLQHRLEEGGGWTLNQEVERILGRLSLDSEADFSSLSGGTKRRVLLARALISTPDLLILDEPTNHLDIQSREILLEALKKFAGTLVLVSHDRHFLRSLVTRVFAIDHGEMLAYEGDYDYYLFKSGRKRQAA